MRKFLLSVLCLFVTLTQSAETLDSNQNFSKRMSNLISATTNIEECVFDEEKEMLVLKTTDNHHLNVLCVWFPENENKRVSIEETLLNRKNDFDYFLIGYGNTPNNPCSYYYLPVNKVKRKIDLDKCSNYSIPYPIVVFDFTKAK